MRSIIAASDKPGESSTCLCFLLADSRVLYIDVLEGGVASWRFADEDDCIACLKGEYLENSRSNIDDA